MSKNYINISPLGACDCVQPGVVASTTTSGGILFTTGELIVIKTFISKNNFSKPCKLDQVPMSLSSVSLPSVSSPAAPVAIELGVPPPQTSPVNLAEFGAGAGGSGSVTPTSEMNEMTNSPPQSSPVNLAQSSSQHQDI